MDQESWRKVNLIFNAALEIEPSRRPAFVVEQSKGNLTVLEEVEALLDADQNAESNFMLSEVLTWSPILQGPSIAVGDVLRGRFRIVRAIAEGGMGQVFEAFDTELLMPVAIKVIRPDVAADAEVVARFRQEVRMAKSVTHPNVCRTFDIEREVRLINGQSAEFLFLSMEFLVGETLAARIKRDGPLSSRNALEIARQIAAALTAAHTLGIVHRDVKPANIMLVSPPSGAQDVLQAVVMDFGLARLHSLGRADAVSGLSNTRQPIGTLAYMAPEQLDGAAVSPATDIYAFGLILFEMITGQRAFPEISLLAGIGSRLRGDFPLAPLKKSGAPSNWLLTIQDCLRVQPVDRPSTLTVVLEMLEGEHHRPPLSFWQLRKSFRQRMPAMTVWLAATLIAVSLFAFGLRLYQSTEDSRVRPGSLVYLSRVRNQTGEKALDNIAKLIEAGLTQSVHVNLLDRSRAEDILRQMKQSPESAFNPSIAREIAMRTGAVRVVLATLSRNSGAYRLEIDLQQPDNVPTRYRRHWWHSWTWTTSAEASATMIGPETAATVRDASDWIRAKVGESANDIARFDAPPDEATTSSWQALADFSEGERLFGQSNRPQALANMQSAIRQDPKFALAEAFEGDILANLGQTQAAYQMYEKALETGSTGRLTLRERDRVLGIIAHDTWDELAAEGAYREYTLFYANDYDGWFRRARPLLMLGRPRDSADALEQAHRLDSTKPAAVVQLVRVELVLGDQNAATTWLNELEKHYPRDWYLFALGPAQFIHGDYTHAAESFFTMTRSPNENLRHVGYTLLASLQAEQGHYPEAIEVTSRSLGRDPDDPDALIHRAALFCRLGQVQSCIADLDRALKLDPAPRLLITASEILGHLAASGGHHAQVARTRLLLLQKGPAAPRYGLVSDIAQHRLAGEVHLAQNRPAAAVAEFRKADALDAPFKPREYLARALVAQAAQTANPPAASRLLQEAAELYGSVALHPMTVWHFPIPYLPGAYADQTETWLQLEKKLARPETEYHAVADSLAELRH